MITIFREGKRRVRLLLKSAEDRLAQQPDLIARIIDENPGNPELVAYNNAIQSLVDARFANGDDILAVDLRSALLGIDGLPDATLYGDALHPNAAGYQNMADAWFGPLTSILDKCP